MTHVILIHSIVISLFIIMLIYQLIKRKMNKDRLKNINNTILIFSKIQEILEISKANIIYLFKYNYEKTFIKSHLIFLIDDKNQIKKELINDLPVTTNTLFLNIFKSHDGTLHHVYKEYLDSEFMEGLFRDTYKMYYKNIFKEKKDEKGVYLKAYPIGYIILSYLKDHTLTTEEIDKIVEIIQDIKILMSN